MDTFSKTPESTLQTGQPLQSSPEESSEKPIEKAKKVFSKASWTFLFTFLPLTVLILISQNTVPGDLFYPVKRGLENAVLAGAAVHPATRVAFRTDLTERRFEEAEKLLLARKDTAGLHDFIQEVSLTEQEIAALKNEDTKKEVTEKLIKKIDEYQSKLVVIQAQARESSAIALALPTPTPKPKTVDRPSTATPVEQAPTAVITFETPTKIQKKSTPTPVSPLLTVAREPNPTTRALEPTSSLTQPLPTEVLQSPTPTQTPTPTSAPIPVGENEIVKAIDDTLEKLEEIKRTAERKQKGEAQEKERSGKGKSSEETLDKNNGRDADKDDKDRENGKKDNTNDKDKEKKGT